MDYIDTRMYGIFFDTMLGCLVVEEVSVCRTVESFGGLESLTYSNDPFASGGGKAQSFNRQNPHAEEDRKAWLLVIWNQS